jgi:hypothetical protein
MTLLAHRLVYSCDSLPFFAFKENGPGIGRTQTGGSIFPIRCIGRLRSACPAALRSVVAGWLSIRGFHPGGLPTRRLRCEDPVRAKIGFTPVTERVPICTESKARSVRCSPPQPKRFQLVVGLFGNSRRSFANTVVLAMFCAVPFDIDPHASLVFRR